ncbi:MAG TPA: pentapeptide repeat-containing protein [Pseudonocardia sp.]|nr:pentapeptide repeat-containing protein [Pseudonocardia sp.]
MLRADCGRCAGLCCVVPAFNKSADFNIDKPAGRACPNLRPDFGCGIHSGLRELGFPGCVVFDCFGAGQHVVQVSFGGRDWRGSPEIAEPMFAVFTVMRQLKELLWYLAEALTLLPAGSLREEVTGARAETERLIDTDPGELAAFDASAYRRRVGPLLERVSRAARGAVQGDRTRSGAERKGRGGRRDRTGADLIGAKLRGADLRGVGLRGAYLIGADLRGADLDRADLLGADLRAADVRRARLEGAIFLTQPQLDAASGDSTTTIPGALARPGHWS